MAEPRIEISIDGNTFQLEKKLKDSVGTASRSGDKAGDAYGKRFSDSIKNIAIGNIVADAAIAGIRLFTNEITQGVNSLRNLSAATAEANSILGANEKITKGVSNQFREFSEQFGTSQQKQVKAFYGIVSGGVKDTANRLAVLETANTAATAGLVDIDTAATALVSSINAYSNAGLTATQTSDQLFTAVRLGQTTFPELAANIGNVAPIASSLGITFSELTGSLANITLGGIKTTRAVSGLRAALDNIVKPSEQAVKAAKELGIELGGNAIRAAGGLANFLEVLIERTNGTSDGLARIFTSSEALTPILSIAERGIDQFRATLDDTEKSAGATALAFQDISKNLDFRFNQVESELQNLRIEFAEELLPTIEDLIPLLKNDLLPLVQGIGKFAATSARGVAGLVGKFRDVIDLGETSERQAAFAESFAQRNKELEKTKTQLESIKIIIAGTSGSEERIAQLERRRLELVKKRNRQEADIFARRLQAEKVGLIEPQTGPGEGLRFTGTDSEDPQAPEDPEDSEGAGSSLNLFDEAKRFTLGGLIGKDKFKEDLKDVSGSIKGLSKEGQAAASALQSGISKSVQGLGASLVTGEDFFQSFLGIALNAIGDMLIAFGTGAITTGAVAEALQKSIQGLVGGPAIVAGLAAIAAGGALKAFSSSLGAAGAGGPTVAPDTGTSTGGVVGPFDSDNSPQVNEEPEERQAQQQVQIVVQGDILDSEDSGRRLLALLNENFESESSSLVGASFA